MKLQYPHRGTNMEHPLKDGMIIGRGPKSDVVLLDGHVSLKHAQVYQRGDEWRIRDLSSSNGTKLNGHRISDSPLNIGDRLYFGGVGGSRIIA